MAPQQYLLSSSATRRACAQLTSIYKTTTTRRTSRRGGRITRPRWVVPVVRSHLLGHDVERRVEGSRWGPQGRQTHPSPAGIR